MDLIQDDLLRTFIEEKAVAVDQRIQAKLFTDLISGYVDVNKELALKIEQITKLSVTDSLTGIYNRMKFNQKLQREIELMWRYNNYFSLIMFDIDHFKKINDVNGHMVGDEILKRMVRLVKENIRQVDIFCRWGGEEFMIVLPHTGKKGAAVFAEKIRQRVESYSFCSGLKITISLGITESFPGCSSEVMIGNVDEALYRAKKKGRNQVCSKFYRGEE